jgi:hypothetical protein
MSIASDDVDEDEFGGDVHAILRLLGRVLRAEGRENICDSKECGEQGGDLAV